MTLSLAQVFEASKPSPCNTPTPTRALYHPVGATFIQITRQLHLSPYHLGNRLLLTRRPHLLQWWKCVVWLPRETWTKSIYCRWGTHTRLEKKRFTESSLVSNWVHCFYLQVRGRSMNGSKADPSPKSPPNIGGNSWRMHLWNTLHDVGS